MKRKLLAALLVCCMAGSALVGCADKGAAEQESETQKGVQEEDAGDTSGGEETSPGEGTAENITIEFFSQKQEEAAQMAYRNAAEDFHKEYPNITVEINTVPDSEKVFRVCRNQDK